MAVDEKPRYHYVVTLKDGEQRNTFAASEEEALRNVTHGMLPEWQEGATVTWRSSNPSKRVIPNVG